MPSTATPQDGAAVFKRDFRRGGSVESTRLTSLLPVVMPICSPSMKMTSNFTGAELRASQCARYRPTGKRASSDITQNSKACGWFPSNVGELRREIADRCVLCGETASRKMKTGDFLHPHSSPVIGPSYTYFHVFWRPTTSCK
jgi:hypothetical protein